MGKLLYINGAAVELNDLVRRGSEVGFTIGGKGYRFRSGNSPDGMLLEQQISEGVWQRIPANVWPGAKDTRQVQLGGLEAKVTEKIASAAQHSEIMELSPRAPMPGLVRQIMVKAGDRVKAGQPLAVMEAMKLQLTLSAGGEATVEAVLVREGEMIAEGTELVELKV